MIRTEREYQAMVKRLDEDINYIEQQRKHFEEMGLGAEQITRALQPALSFHEQLKEEVEYYERIKRGDFGALENLAGLGRLLIGLRIALGMTQSELAKRLSVSEAQVSRDERNEYYGISIEKAQRILDALNVRVTTRVERIPDRAVI